MTVLITSDWHFSDDPRDAYRFRIVEDVLPELLKKYKVDALLNLGDITEAKDGHSAELVNRTVEVFAKLARRCPVVISQGNHDWLSSPENPFFRFLQHLKDVYWVRQEPVELEHFTAVPHGARLNAIILPHTADPERDWKEIDFKKYDWAFAHQTFANATADSGKFKLSGVPLSMFPKGLKIISGDIHKPQTLGPLVYVGSPYTVDFGDDFEARCLLIKDSEELVSIPIKGPQKRLIEAKSLADLEKKLKELDKHDIVKVRLNVSTEEQSDWGRLAAEVRSLGTKSGVAVHMVQPLVTGAAGGAMKRKDNATQRTDDQLLQDYGSARSVDEGTLKAGMKLL